MVPRFTARVNDSMILPWSGSETTAGGVGLGENLRNLHLEVVKFHLYPT